MKKVLLLFIISLIVLPLFADISVNEDGNYSVKVNKTTLVFQKDISTVYSYPEIREKASGKNLRVPTINELKSLFDDIKNRNYSSSFDTFSLSFSLGFFKGMYSYDLCYFIVTKDGKIGTVSVNSNTFKLNENSFVALNDPDDRCPPTLLWRIIE